MAGPRRKHLAASKRRADEEGEDEEGSTGAGLDDDSMSEASAVSDADDDADAEGSESSDADIPQPSKLPIKTAVNGLAKSQPDAQLPVEEAASKPSFAVMTNDTAAMMNGLQLGQDVDDAEEIQFDDMATAGCLALRLQVALHLRLHLPQLPRLRRTSPIRDGKNMRSIRSEETLIHLSSLTAAVSSCTILAQRHKDEMAFDLSGTGEAKVGDEVISPPHSQCLGMVTHPLRRSLAFSSLYAVKAPKSQALRMHLGPTISTKQ